MVTQSSDKVKQIDVTEAHLKTAMRRNHELEYKIEDDSVKNNFVLVGTSMLKLVWKAYNAWGTKVQIGDTTLPGLSRKLMKNGGRQILIGLSNNQT